MLQPRPFTGGLPRFYRVEPRIAEKLAYSGPVNRRCAN